MRVSSLPLKLAGVLRWTPAPNSYARTFCAVLDVRFWHKADKGWCTAHVRFWG